MAPSGGFDDAFRGQHARSGRSRFSRSQRLVWAVTGSALIAPFTGAALVGSTVVDWCWSAALAGAAAYLAVSAKRGPLLFAALVAALSGRSWMAAGFAAVALVSAALATRHLRRRAVLGRGIAGGATVLSLLAPGGSRGTAATVLAVVLVGALIAGSGYRQAPSPAKRTMRRIAVGVAGASLVVSASAVVGVLQNAHRIDVGTAELEAGLASARQGDATAAALHLDRARVSLAQAESGIDRWGTGARVVPFAAQHVSTLTSTLGAVNRAGIQAGQVARLVEAAPLSISAGHIDVDVLASLASPLGRLADDLAAVVDRVDHRPGGPLLPALQHRLDLLRDRSARAQTDAESGAQAARRMPAVLGASGPRRYLVLFTSPSEARGRFGFPGSYAEVIFDGGKLQLGEHGSTTERIPIATVDQTPFDLGDPLLRPYVPFAVTQAISAVTTPPDFPTVARVAAEIWRQTGRPPVDGVLRFDPASLAPLLSFTGPVQVPGQAQPLTAENLERFLVADQYVQFPDVKAAAPRRELLGVVADETFDRLQTADLPAPRALFDLFRPLVAAGHLQIDTFGPGEAAFLDRVRVSGRLRSPASDSLLVTNVNALGNKIDSLLSRSVTYSGQLRKGTFTGTAEIQLHNAATSSRLPFYVIGSTFEPAPPLGTNRTTLFVYTSVPTTAVRIDGREVRVLSQRTGGRWLHQITVEIPPGGTVTVALDLQGALPDGPYELALVPGGGSVPDHYRVDVAAGDGRVTFDGPVDAEAVLR
jgi:hypothetical protein